MVGKSRWQLWAYGNGFLKATESGRTKTGEAHVTYSTANDIDTRVCYDRTHRVNTMNNR